MKNFQISASILSANFACLGEEVKKVLNAGADWVHVDVMDNHYVPNLTFGPVVCESLRKFGIKAPLDVHLMVKPVDELIKRFAEAGVTTITIHPEATEHLDRSLQLIRDLGCQAGLALNPATPVSCLDHILDKLDLILIMSVNPGFGGQQFIPGSLQKIRAVRDLLQKANKEIYLAVDGGIKCDNIRSLAEAGADTFIMGSAIFSANDYQAVIAKMCKELESCRVGKGA